MSLRALCQTHALPGQVVCLPDSRARVAWILVNEKLDNVLPGELVRMIGMFLTYDLVSCSRGQCVGFFKKEWGHGKDKEFCSDTCESLFRNYDAYAHAVVPSGSWGWGHPQGVIDGKARVDIGELCAEYARVEKERHIARETTMAILYGNCKACKKKLVTSFKDTDYCSKACFKKRWKK